MTANPEAFEPDDSIAFIINAMHVGSYRHVPVVDEQNQPVAIVSVRDILSFIAEHFTEEVINLPPHPIRKTKEREGA
ncbi:MAG: CBS domain-containing protein [Ignavibacteriales bacterium]|nr:CBS domain-containing protein [Ignavibacteriales bacterium]